MRQIALWGVLAAGVGAQLPMGSAAAQARAATRSYAVLSNGDRIGKLDVVTAGNVVDIDWHVDENGRGPKMKEHVELGPGGIPVVWQIEGVGPIGITMSPARGKKCGRCWQYREEVVEEGGLCARCEDVVAGMALPEAPTV